MSPAIRSNAALGLLGTALVLAVWEGASRSGLIDPAIFPGPVTAAIQAAERLSAGRLAEHAAWSLLRVVAGFSLGTAAGLVIGVLAAWSRGFGLLVRPVIELLRPVPPLAWIPLAIIWFGLGEPSKFFIIFLGAFFPVVTSAYQGVRGVDPTLIRAARTFGSRDGDCSCGWWSRPRRPTSRPASASAGAWLSACSLPPNSSPPTGAWAS